MSNSPVPTSPDLLKLAAEKQSHAGQAIFVIVLLLLGLAACWLAVRVADRRNGHSQNLQCPRIILLHRSAQETA